MSYHKTLQSQINKILPPDYLKDKVVADFLDIINRTYITFERDKRISDHAFEVSENEYQATNEYLQNQNEITTQSILKLNQAIRELDPDSLIELNSDAGLIQTISYLQDKISKAKTLEAELKQAIDVAEKAVKAKSEFLSIMSHEIRTPLYAIIGTILLLRDEQLTKEQGELVRVLHISSENLLSLINDVLDFNKLEEGKIVFAEKDIDIIQFLKNIKASHRIRAEERQNTIKITFDDDIPSYVVGDDVRLAQVLNNLVGNANKFTRRGNVNIQVSLKEQTPEYVTLNFAVSDTGIGIPLEKQKQIFESFTQADAHITREFGGSGLGLAIVRKLLILQDSNIGVESEEGKGSTFFFELTFKRSHTISKQELSTINIEQKDLKGINVLLVEDAEFNIMVGEGLLKKWNTRITTAENGQVAVEKAKANKYDIILMDIHMPVMDGYSATEAIRKFDTEVPIIALSASISNEIQEKASKMGMNGFVIKPFNPNDLYSVIYKFTLEGR
ncbi:MAG: response regulator [Sphingobacteriia bacterium]|nr:response regulator [Sphingobacteriia bacterium]